MARIRTYDSLFLKLIGFQSIKKKELAEAMIALNTDFCLQVRTATQLPLPSMNDEKRPKIDLIVFIFDVNINMSLKTIAESLPHVDPTYFLGRVCFLALNASSDRSQCADLGDIIALCDSYDSPLICGDLETQEQRESLARRIVEMTEIAAGFKHGVSPLLVQSTRRSYQFVKSL
nr:centromere protein M-like [Lytechinus pictus]